MENLKKFLQNRFVITAAISLAAGLVFGLVYGYIINPIEWEDASMDMARTDLQEDYLRMAIDSYRIHGNELLAVTRWRELGEAANALLEKIKYSPGDQGWEAVYEYEKAVTIRDARPSNIECETVSEPSNTLCISLWSGTTLLVIGLAVYFYLRTRPLLAGHTAKPLPVFKRLETWMPPQVRPSRTDNDMDDVLESEKERFLKNPPLVNHIWTFVMGDDQYEESHSIDAKSGDFLGECGIEIAKTLDNSSPKKATAFDIWLFDKNEINTRSIILMSHNAYDNDILRTQFEMKGMPVLAEIGKEIEIKTDHLLMQMRVLDMICDQAKSGRCEYFQRLSLDVNIWQQ